MTYEIIHSVILILTIFLAFVMSKTSLSQYDLEIAAGLFILLYISKRIFTDSRKSKLVESVVFTFIIVGVINTTGDLKSPFFFLIYFLMFALSLLLEPVISIVTSLTLVVFFLFTLGPGEPITNLMPIFALALLTPFALFTGQEYIKYHAEKKKASILEEAKSHQEEQSFLFLSLILKNHLKQIEQSVENFTGDHELHSIRKQAREMNKLIDAYEQTVS